MLRICNKLLYNTSLYNNRNNIYLTFRSSLQLRFASSKSSSYNFNNNFNNNLYNSLNNNHKKNNIYTKELTKEVVNTKSNNRKAKQHVQTLFQLVKNTTKEHWKLNVIEYFQCIRSLNQYDELIANVNYVQWNDISPEALKVVSEQMREVLERLLEKNHHNPNNLDNINKMATCLVSLYLQGGMKEEAEEVVRLAPSQEVYALMLTERLKSLGPASAWRYYSTTPALGGFDKSHKFNQFLLEMKNHEWTFNTYYAGLQYFASNFYAQLIHSQNYDHLISQYSSDQLASFIVLIELSIQQQTNRQINQQQDIPQKQQMNPQQQQDIQQLQTQKSILSNFEISMKSVLPKQLISSVLSSSILHFIHLNRYELALKWYARRLFFELSPDSDSIFHFIHYHEGKSSSTQDIELLKHWDEMRFDYGFLKKYDQQTRIEFNRRFLFFLQQGVKATSNTVAAANINPILPPLEPTKFDIELDKALEDRNNFDALCRTLYRAIKNSHNNIPTGMRLLNAFKLIRELRSSYFLHYKSGLPKSILPLAFLAGDYSKLKTYPSETIKYLATNHHLMYNSNSMILNYLVVGLSQTQQVDLLTSLMTRMVSNNNILFEWAIESAVNCFINNNLNPDQLLTQMETIYSVGGGNTSIRNCILNSIIENASQSNEIDQDSINQHISRIHQPNLLTHTLVLKLYDQLLKQQDNQSLIGNTDEMIEFLQNRLPTGTFQMRHNSVLGLLLKKHQSQLDQNQPLTALEVARNHVKKYYSLYLKKENLDLLLVFSLSKIIVDSYEMVEIFKQFPVAKGYHRDLINTMKKHNEIVNDQTLQRRLYSKDIWSFTQNSSVTFTPEAAEFVTNQILN